MSKIDRNYDIIIIGAGMIGAAMAIGLAKEGWKILLLEHTKPVPFNPLVQPDLRVSALNCASVDLLKQLGVWDNVLKMRVAPYQRLEIWECENTHVIFEAKSVGLPELGYIVENRVIQLALWQQFSQYPNLTLLCPANLVTMEFQDQHWKINLNNNQQTLTHLIIAADGAFSKVRSLAGIGSNGWQYNKSCILITVKLKELHHNITWQQFFPSGPRAFLPLFDHWACLVWYDHPGRIRQLQSMSLEQIRQEIILAFPTCIGVFQVVAKGSFMLNRHHANRYVYEGFALIGDAAHSINPLAGQGVNLGYRDVDGLLKVLINAKENLLPFYIKKTLLVYQNNRMIDNQLMQASMDAIYILFGSQLEIIKLSRNLALLLLERFNGIKKIILKYALGL